MTGNGFIPFHQPSVGEEEIQEAVAALKSGWLTTGPRTAQFEREFVSYTRAPHALAVNSGTAALHLPLAALGVGAGDEVITTPLTFCATVNTIMQVGATPVLADVGEDGNIDPNEIARRINHRTRAILPVHLAGLVCDMESIWSLAAAHNLFVIEDAAHAAGATYRGVPVGARHPQSGAASAAVAFSFYATKNLTTGEGGMVTTHDSVLAASMRCLCLHGISKDAWNRYAESGNWYYQVEMCGFKYNLSDLQSAVGIHQLRKLDGFIEVRKQFAARYSAALSEVDEIELPPDGAWHLYMIRLRLDRLKIDRAEFIRRLRERGVGASVHFIPVPLHPYFREHAALPHNQCPRAMALYPRLVSLPLYPAMSPEQVDHVACAVKEIVETARKPRYVSAAG